MIINKIVWYGAGENPEDNFTRYEKETGLPVCICDGDVAKQNTLYKIHGGGGIKVISLSDALSKYPDCELYITLAEHNVSSCYEYLVEMGVDKRKIKFFGDKEYRLGCMNLNYYCYISSDNVKVCAH